MFCAVLDGVQENIASLLIPLRHIKAKVLVALALEPAGSFFLPAATAFVSSQRKTGECSVLDVDLKKATYSFLSIEPTVGAHLPLECSL